MPSASIAMTVSGRFGRKPATRSPDADAVRAERSRRRGDLAVGAREGQSRAGGPRSFQKTIAGRSSS